MLPPIPFRVNVMYKMATVAREWVYWLTSVKDAIDGHLTATDPHTAYSLASGTRAFTGTVAGVTPTSSSHLATKGYVDTAVLYTPVAAYADTGTLATGHTVSRVQTKDGTDYQVTEANGADPLRVRFVFENVTGFDTLLVYGRYQGSASHEIHIEIYNRAATAWETVWEIISETANRWYTVPLWYSGDYITNPGTNNYVEVRFNHVSNGVNTHNLYVDYIALRRR